MSTEKLVLIELLGPGILVVSIISVAIIRLGLVFNSNDAANTFHTPYMLLIMTVVILFTTGTYQFHLAVRAGIMLVMQVFGQLPPIQILVIVLITALLEISQFMTWKAKMDLFVRIKASEQQHSQLTDLLDTVPDSVLICSKK